MYILHGITLGNLSPINVEKRDINEFEYEAQYEVPQDHINHTNAKQNSLRIFFL